MRAGNPWKAIRSRARRNQRVKDSSSPNSSSSFASQAAMSSGSPESAANRNGPEPRQKSGRMNAGTKPGKSKARSNPGALRLRADVVAVVEDDGAGVEITHHRSHLVGATLKGAPLIFVGIALAQLGGSGEREARRNVTVEQVVRRRLIRYRIGRKPSS